MAGDHKTEAPVTEPDVPGSQPLSAWGGWTNLGILEPLAVVLGFLHDREQPTTDTAGSNGTTRPARTG